MMMMMMMMMMMKDMPNKLLEYFDKLMFNMCKSNGEKREFREGSSSSRARKHYLYYIDELVCPLDYNLYDEMMTRLLHKNENRFYNIYGEDYNIKSNPNPHSRPVFYVNPWTCDSSLVIISVLHLILPPQQS